MSFSYTGLAFLLGSFAVGLLSYRFFQYWQREKTIISRLFLYMAGVFTLFMLITAVSGLFFAQNTTILKLTVIFAAFIQAFAFAVIGYIIFYLKFPRVSPWLGVIPIFLLGLVSTVLTIILPFNPYLEPSGGINWDNQPVADTIRFFLFLISFLPLSFIMVQQSRISKDPAVKRRAIGISILLLFGIVTGLLDFFLENMLKLGALGSDVGMAVISVVIFVTVFFTQKPPKKEQKISSSSSERIKW